MEIGDMLFSKASESKPSDVLVEVTDEVTIKRRRRKVVQVVEAQEVPSAPTDVVLEDEAKSKPVYNTYEDYDYKDLLTYAGIDTYATSTIVARMFPDLVHKPDYIVQVRPGTKITTKAPSLLDIYSECSSRIFDFICDLELNGINYDVEANRRLDRSMRQEVSFLEDRIFSAIGHRINLDSSVEMTNYLYGQRGFKPPHQTKSGADAVDGAALLTLAGLDPMSPGKYVTKDPALQFLADIAKRKNMASVHRGFISTYMDDYLQPDGRIHALYNQFGTSTFRLSSSEPNLN